MDRFKKYLKRTGKKEHVIEGLVNQIRAAEAYLKAERQVELDSAEEEDIRHFTQILPTKEIKKRMRALALYFEFSRNAPLASLARAIREKEVAKTRRRFKLRHFCGINLEEVVRLETIGIVTVDDMLAAGKTPLTRQQLAEKTNVPLESILELVQLSDLSRLGAVKGVRARLYFDAGLDKPSKFID